MMTVLYENDAIRVFNEEIHFCAGAGLKPEYDNVHNKWTLPTGGEYYRSPLDHSDTIKANGQSVDIEKDNFGNPIRLWFIRCRLKGLNINKPEFVRKIILMKHILTVLKRDDVQVVRQLDVNSKSFMEDYIIVSDKQYTVSVNKKDKTFSVKCGGIKSGNLSFDSKYLQQKMLEKAQLVPDWRTRILCDLMDIVLGRGSRL